MCPKNVNLLAMSMKVSIAAISLVSRNSVRVVCLEVNKFISNFTPQWCKVVQIHHKGKTVASNLRPPAKQQAKTARVSISFSPILYSDVERLAKEKKVSIAWVVREATEKYVSEQWPLFAE